MACGIAFTFLIGTFTFLADRLRIDAGYPRGETVKRYNCMIGGEQGPVSSDDYYRRAQKHFEGIKTHEQYLDSDGCFFDAVNESLRIDPNNADALALRGLGYFEIGWPDRGNADIDRAIEIVPNHLNAHLSRCHYLKSRLEFKNAKAIECITTVIRIAPDGYDALDQLYRWRADLYRDFGDYSSALDDINEAIKIRPSESSHKTERANLLGLIKRKQRNESQRKRREKLSEAAEEILDKIRGQSGI